MTTGDRPFVSVIVTNRRPGIDASPCLDAVAGLDWPAAQRDLIVLNDAAPVARNQAAETALGEYLAFLGSDVVPDPGWLTHAVAALESDSRLACAASRIVDAEGRPVDFTAPALAHYAAAGGVATTSAATGDVELDIPFASASAMVVRADVFRAVGGFDPRYDSVSDDADLGWRLWLVGHRVHLVLVRSFAVRSTAGAGRPTPGRRSSPNATPCSPSSRTTATTPSSAPFPRRCCSPSSGGWSVDAFGQELPSLLPVRQAIQRGRTVGDSELLRLFPLPFHPMAAGAGPTSQAAAAAFGAQELVSRRQRILVATGDTLTPQMAGPAIRAWQIASELSAEHEVQLVTHQACTLTDPRFVIRQVNELDLPKLVEWCDVLIFQGFLHAPAPHPASVEQGDRGRHL